MKKPTQIEKTDWFSFVLNEHQKPAIPVGPRFQADVPEWNGPFQREYPHKTTGKSFSSKWLGTVIWSNKDTSVETDKDAIGKGRPQHCDCYNPGSLLCVKRHVTAKISDLRKDLGSAFQIWKFDEMGEVVAKSWKHSEQQKFARVVKTNPISEDVDDKKKISKSKVVLKRKRGDSSGSDKEEDSSDSSGSDKRKRDDKEKKKLKGKGAMKIKKDDSPSRELVIPDDVMKQLMKNLLKNSFVKEEADEENELKPKKKGKKKVKVLTEAEIQHEKYISRFPILHARTAPTALKTAINGIKNVNIEKFLADIGFSSFFKLDIGYIPSRLGRYVVENFDAETCRLKLEDGKSIEATVSKVHEMLGIPIGGESLFSLEPRPVEDDFEKVWIRQFDPKSVKEIRVNDIAMKLIESKEVDFLFKVNFLTLFTNIMGMVAGLKGQINLDVVRRVREYTDISCIDWCEYIFRCLKSSKKPSTLLNQYTGPYTFLILLYLDSTKYEKLPVVRTRPAIKNWSSVLMGQRQELELKEEVIGTLKLHEEWTESEVAETEGFIPGGSSDTSFKEELLNKVQEKLDVICTERHDLEQLLAIASVEFPADVKLVELHKKYVQIFKHPIPLNDEDLSVEGNGDDDNDGDDGNGDDGHERSDDHDKNDKDPSGSDPKPSHADDY
ncbi:ELM2 domain-containing protein [Artemisia annua]|uniref:ELM2 domain-containing protein n=1 Tax=Artemisia annua TaxID=35608 RepID=A0A2U1LWM9_ARTAN|nr:ELM2 domain-containing protein [Artemisia annua]